MITWNDFVLDQETGPLLWVEMDPGQEISVCRRCQSGRPSVMEDAGDAVCVSIQETRQEQRPARMVGLSSLDFARTGMEASRCDQTELLRRRGEV